MRLSFTFRDLSCVCLVACVILALAAPSSALAAKPTGTAPSFTPSGRTYVFPAGATIRLTAGITGTPPFRCVWKHNGVVIPKATSITLEIPNADSADDGSYWVLATNAYGSNGGIVAGVTVFGPPIITAQPARITTTAGYAAYFSVVASGATYCQWLQNDKPVAASNASGADSYILSITNATLANAGNYSVLITNAFGNITSQPANLTVKSGATAFATDPLIVSCTAWPQNARRGSPSIIPFNLALVFPTSGYKVHAQSATNANGIMNLPISYTRTPGNGSPSPHQHVTLTFYTTRDLASKFTVTANGHLLNPPYPIVSGGGGGGVVVTFGAL